jgi:uncharacterized membrane protein YkgB
VTQPHIAFIDGNPFMLTMTGEFVIKNLVLMAAGLVLATQYTRREARAVERESVAAVEPVAALKPSE